MDLQYLYDAISEFDSRPVMYGSYGLSHYLGNFKEFNDIDILINDECVNSRWNEFKICLNDKGWKLIDEEEHEFAFENQKIGFASKKVLLRDKILSRLDGFVKFKDTNFLTLKPEQFLKAYEFSSKDGYRKDKRGKKDEEIRNLLKEYMSVSSLN